jgi:hypothetical protein
MAEMEPVDKNVYYMRLGWTSPEVPIGHEMTRQDLVILMTACSRVRFLVTGQTREYRHLKPTDVCSALTQDILDIERVLLDGKASSAPKDTDGVPMVVIAKKGAHSPLEKVKDLSAIEGGEVEPSNAELLSIGVSSALNALMDDEEIEYLPVNDEEEGLCTLQ